MARFLKFISSPRTAFFGAIGFAAFWFVTGAYNDFFLKPIYEGINNENYLSWSSDILGHYLCVTTFFAAGTFWFYNIQVEELISGGEGFENKKTKVLKKWLFICLFVCFLMATSNFYYVSFSSVTKSHWHHLLFPFYLPALIAFIYYFISILPLFMSLISFGYNVNYSVVMPEKLQGFSETDSENCFGVSHLGNSLALISFFIFIIMFPAIAIQIAQKEEITIGSLIIVPFSLYVLYAAVFKPGFKLSTNLINIKRKRVDEAKDKLRVFEDDMTKSQDDAAIYNILKERIRDISKQKIVPISKPFAIGGYFILAPTISISVLAWIKSMIESIKVISG